MNRNPSPETVPPAPDPATDPRPVRDEAYWHVKHPVAPIAYRGRTVPGTDKRFNQDVRTFIPERDFIIEKRAADIGAVGVDVDVAAHRVQLFVYRYLTYVSDESLGCPEYWMYPQETMERRSGDCEDGALTITALLWVSLPATDRWRIRMTCGLVRPGPTAPEGGHGWATWCRSTDNEWVALDWCFLADPDVTVDQKPLLRDRPEYVQPWFSLNGGYAWSHDTFQVSGRMRVMAQRRLAGKF